MPSPQRCFYEEDAVKHGMALDSAPAENLGKTSFIRENKMREGTSAGGRKGLGTGGDSYNIFSGCLLYTSRCV